MARGVLVESFLLMPHFFLMWSCSAKSKMCSAFDMLQANCLDTNNGNFELYNCDSISNQCFLSNHDLMTCHPVTCK